MLAIITARGGSKGIPCKNLRRVGNRTLTQIAVDTAIQLKDDGIVDDVFLSTDSKAILDMSMCDKLIKCGLRSKKLSGDNVKSIDVILDILENLRLKGKEYDSVILLQPTSPLRTVDETKQAIKMYLNSGKESLISVGLLKNVSINGLYKYYNNKFTPVSNNHNKGIPRQQENEKLFLRNGAIFIVSTEHLRNKKSVISEDPAVYEMSEEHSINIDSFSDLEDARKIFCSENRDAAFGVACNSKIQHSDNSIKIDVDILRYFVRAVMEGNVDEYANIFLNCLYCDGTFIYRNGIDVTENIVNSINIKDFVVENEKDIIIKYIDYLSYDATVVVNDTNGFLNMT